MNNLEKVYGNAQNFGKHPNTFETISVDPQVSRNKASKDKLVDSMPTQLIMFRDYLEIHENFTYSRPTGVRDDALDPVLAQIYEENGDEEEREVRNGFCSCTVKRDRIEMIGLEFCNIKGLYEIMIGCVTSQYIPVDSYKEGREIQLKLTNWWLGL